MVNQQHSTTIIDPRSQYLTFSDHTQWKNHYTESCYGGYLLVFSENFMNEVLPKKTGFGIDEVIVELIDSERNNEVYLIGWWLNYEQFPKQIHKWILTSNFDDSNYEDEIEYFTLMEYIYGSKLCPCNIKSSAYRAGAPIIPDSIDSEGNVEFSCEGDRFKIRSITLPAMPELILYSETLSQDELENILQKDIYV